MKAIVVSGTPAAGKTTIAKDIAKRIGAKYIDAKKVIKENRLSESYDKDMKCDIVDPKRLNKALIEIIKSSDKPVVIDSHIAHLLPKSYVQAVIIAKATLRTLRNRMKKRKYPEQKILENLEAEIFDVCRVEAEEKGHRVYIIDTTGGYNVSDLPVFSF